MRSDEQKLALLRQLTREGFDALDRDEGLALESDRQLLDAIARIGRGAAETDSRYTAIWCWPAGDK